MFAGHDQRLLSCDKHLENHVFLNQIQSISTEFSQTMISISHVWRVCVWRRHAKRLGSIADMMKHHSSEWP